MYDRFENMTRAQLLDELRTMDEKLKVRTHTIFFALRFFSRPIYMRELILLFPTIPNFSIFDVKKGVLIDLKIDGPNLVKSEDFFFKWIVCATWWLNMGKFDMFSG